MHRHMFWASVFRNPAFKMSFPMSVLRLSKQIVHSRITHWVSNKLNFWLLNRETVELWPIGDSDLAVTCIVGFLYESLKCKPVVNIEVDEKLIIAAKIHVTVQRFGSSRKVEKHYITIPHLHARWSDHFQWKVYINAHMCVCWAATFKFLVFTIAFKACFWTLRIKKTLNAKRDLNW